MPTTTEPIKLLPEKFRRGYIIMDDGDFKVYLLFLLATTAFFFVLYELYRIILIKLKVQSFI